MAFRWQMIVAFTFPILAQAAAPVSCRIVAERPFWNRSEPVTFGTTSEGQPLEETFSFDSEILIGDLWEHLNAHLTPAEREEAAQTLNRGLEISRSKALKTLGVSERQLATFYLRAGVSSKKSVFVLTDFRRSALSQLFVGLEPKKIGNVMRLLSQSAVPLLAREGLAVNSHVDLTSPEFTHPSFETSPAAYRAQIEKLHELLPQAQTHFHIGLPAEKISQRDAVEIARAVEAPMVLRWVVASSGVARDNLSYYFSAFTNPDAFFIGERGLLKLQHNGFTKPVLAHDIEIRQWIKLSDGFDGIEIASHLAQQSARGELPFVDIPVDHSNRFDPRYGSIAASLDYVGQVLGEDPSLKDVALATRQLAIRATQSDVIVSQGSVTSGQRTPVFYRPEFLKELVRFCRANDLVTKYRDVITHRSLSTER